MALRLGMWTSKPLYICPGLPWHSALSPVLFNMYTARLARIQPAGPGQTLSFVCDELLCQTGLNRQNMVSDRQDTLKSV